MRSIVFSFLLLLVTAGVAVVSVMSLRQGSLDEIFGSRFAEVGENLFKIEPEDVNRIRRIQVAGNGVQADCVFEKGIWRTTRPWQDRMDPRAAQDILQFTLGTRVVDIIPEGKLDTTKILLKEGTIGINIEDQDGKTLAKYLLGRKTEWTDRNPETKEENDTVFIQPGENNSGNYTYAATGDIHPIFKDGLRHLRDHHPFLLNPFALSAVRIQGSEGELLLSRADAASPWRITKPLELRTNPEAVRKLIEDLSKLRAFRVANRSEVTLPADGANGRRRIAIKHFGQKEEVVLEIYPPKIPEADTLFAYATVSDRPGAVFELPLKPLPGLTDPVPEEAAAPAAALVSLAGLPDTVNERRNPMLTNIDPESIQGILITPSTGKETFLMREKGTSWSYRNEAGRMAPANEITLYRLLKAVTGTKVLGFVTDAAMDLTPYGLDRPSLSIRFTSFGGEGFELVFGRSLDGIWYAMRTGVPTVMKLDDQFIREISTHLYEWRQPQVWSIPQVDIKGIERIMEGRPPLFLEYDFYQQGWKAKVNGIDRSAELVTERANQLLKLLVGLQSQGWLAPDDEAANRALATPAMKFALAVATVDAQGERSGVAPRQLLIAPASDSPENRIFYCRVDADPYPFLLGVETVRRLAVDLFGDD